MWNAVTVVFEPYVSSDRQGYNIYLVQKRRHTSDHRLAKYNWMYMENVKKYFEWPLGLVPELLLGPSNKFKSIEFCYCTIYRPHRQFFVLLCEPVNAKMKSASCDGAVFYSDHTCRSLSVATASHARLSRRYWDMPLATNHCNAVAMNRITHYLSKYVTII